MTKRVVFGIALTLLLICMLALAADIQLVKSESSVCVKVVPEAVFCGPPGDEFTVAVVVEDVGELCALQIDLSWNATLLGYVSHTVTISVENHSNGILHEPALILNDDVDPTLGTSEIAAACLYEAPSFNGSGTVFEITFLANTTGTCVLDIFISHLADRNSQIIDHSVTDGTVDVGVTIPGDVDTDFDVDLYDAVKLLVCYGVKEGEPRYEPNLDIDGDGEIFLYDAVILCGNYGQKLL